MAGIIDNTPATRRDLKLFSETFATTAGKMAADKGVKIARQAIEIFYSSYGPSIYLRTDNLKNNSYERYYKNNGNKVYGGVVISSNKMAEYQYGTWSAAKVASSTWAGGAHGNVHTYPPLSIAEMQFGSVRSAILASAFNTAKNRGYATLTF